MFVIVFMLIMSLPNHSFSQTQQEEHTYIVFLEDNKSINQVTDYDIEIEKYFEVLHAIKIKTTPSQIAQLDLEGLVNEYEIEKEYEITSQVTPSIFETIKLTPEVRSQYTGKGVKVGVLDTGIDKTHPDLNVAGGVCVVTASCGKDYSDGNGHGTHVAGVIAAQNNGVGIVGVAPDVELYAIKGLDESGFGTTSTILAGIEWAITNDMDILNMSFTTESDDRALRLSIQKAYNSGIILVAAAGNTGTSDTFVNTVMYPAKYPEVIAVGGVDESLRRMKESSTGPEVEIVAVGQYVRSAFPMSIDTRDGQQDGYMNLSGTSMAAPYITGMLALLKEQLPYQQNEVIRKILTDSAKDLGAVGKDPLYGYGLVQYPDKLSANLLPYAYVKENKNGKIHFQFETDSTTKSVDIAINGKQIKKNLVDYQFIDYMPKGTYEYHFIFNGSTDPKEVKLPVTVAGPYFKDLSAQDWYAPHMVFLYERNILSGTNNGTLLKPSTNITRGEAVALIGRALGFDGTTRKTVFHDVGNQYFASGYIQSAFDRKILQGFPDKTFRPNQPVTRAEMAILLANAYKLKLTSTQSFTDINENVTGYQAIYKLAEAQITQGYPDKSFQPYEYMTRSMFSVFLARAENPNFITR